MEISVASDYIINENGEVFSKERVVQHKNGKKYTYKSHLRKPSVNRGGYLVVGLYIDKKKQFFYVHRLIAIAFIPNPNNLPCVNHKNQNRKDNSISNLEWCTNMYNSQSINTIRNFGNIHKDKRCNSYQTQYRSNGITHFKNFKKESDAVVHLVIAEIFVRFEAQLI
tara:strand:- start:649 stop:1149 length:501 start_codon:yes stop_codon:yes gene_type:complete